MPRTISDFQRDAYEWLVQISEDIDKPILNVSRRNRFLEEAIELFQACGGEADEAKALVDYTFSRPLGQVKQEIGGVMVTLACLSSKQGLSMHICGNEELQRCNLEYDRIAAKMAGESLTPGPLPGEDPQ